MRYRLAEMPARPCAGRRDPCSFPARIRHKTSSIIVSMAAIVLIYAAVFVGGTARAESVTAVWPKTSPDAGPYGSFVREAAQRFGIPASWIGAVMAIESGGDVLALSSQGAMGLMQIMPETWAGLRARHGFSDNSYDPRDNILAGAAYLRELYDRYGSPGFLSAYNAGPGRYDEHLATGRALPQETQLYVATLAPLIEEAQVDDIVTVSRRLVPWQEAPLFVARDQDKSAVPQEAFNTLTEQPSEGEFAENISRLKARTDSLFVRRGNAVRLP